MYFDKKTIKKIVLILFSAIAFHCALQNISSVLSLAHRLLGIFLPFLIGGAIAFILNIPMSRIEGLLFPKNGLLDRFRRPLAYLITLILATGIIVLVFFVVVPEKNREKVT